MNLEKVNQALAKRFQAPLRSPYKRRILFWYDDEAEFQDDLDKINFGDAKLLVIDNNYFEIKHTLEIDDLESNYVIYSPAPKPDFRQNWLLDILLYSEEFSADRASIIMDELGIEDLALKHVVKENLPFFDSQARVNALKKLEVPLQSEKEIQLAMMAVVCRCKTVDFESVLFSVFMDKIDDNDNALYQHIKKYPGLPVFWQFVHEHIGYESEEPSLKKLFVCIVFTVTASQLNQSMAQPWGHFFVHKKNNAQILIDRWMNHKDCSDNFDYLAIQVFHEYELKKQFQDMPPENCLEADTFEFFDMIIILGIVNKLLDDQTDYETWLSWITKRKASHWYKNFENVYMALEAAIQLFRFKHHFSGSFPKLAPADMMEKYTSDYFRADQYYRWFCKYYQNVQQDILKPLLPKVDDLYCNWFLENLNQTWSDVVQEKMIRNWAIEGVRPQRKFYKDYIKTNVLDKNDREKIFVIISDALRFEIAQELESELLKEFRGETALEYMLGCIPSFTALGMAYLLPNKEVTLNDQARICVNGLDTTSLLNREHLLKQTYNGSRAIKLRELVSKSKEEAREMVRDCRVVYLYHNTIDAMGEKLETENKLFHAVDEALKEIVDGVKRIVHSLGTTNVIITADHGFLFQTSEIHESDKIQKSGVQGIISNRRFLLAEQGETVDGALQISLSSIFENGSNLVAYVPRGNIRFKHSGGSLYVHGGASLQEVVIPVLQYTHARKQSQKAKETKKVDVTLTNKVKKITNNIFTLNFFQTENISPKILPRKIRVSLWDTQGKQVSTEGVIHADCDSDQAEDRTFTLRLKLMSGVKNGNYDLRLIDDETQMEYEAISFEVSVGIQSDFDDF